MNPQIFFLGGQPHIKVGGQLLPYVGGQPHIVVGGQPHIVVGQPHLVVGGQPHLVVGGQPHLVVGHRDPSLGQPVRIGTFNNNQFINTSFLFPCKVPGCSNNCCGHYCYFCKNLDSDHRTRNCPFRLCKAPGCFKCGPGQSHYCSYCRNPDSDHRTKNCPFR